MPQQERKKNERVEARVNAETKALFQRAAEIQGRSLTDFVVHSAAEVAKRVIRENEYLDLSQRDRLEFVKAVLSPPMPSDRLKQAAQRHEQMFGNR